MDRGFKEYTEEVKAEISAAVFAEDGGAISEDKFTEYCLEILDEAEKSEGAQILRYIYPNSSGGTAWKINGYCLKDSYEKNNKIFYETVDLFITHYDANGYSKDLSIPEFRKHLTHIKNFLNGCLKDSLGKIDPSHKELLELRDILFEQKKSIDRFNIFFLLNSKAKDSEEQIVIKRFEDLNIQIHIWDINRFFKLNQSTSHREPIEIDLENNSRLQIIPSLKVPSINELYECYLAIVPGTVLSELYSVYSSELLESNVRAFLGQAGKYNKGIRDTIRNKPEMFLPYNNGITATAENVTTSEVDGQLFITGLKDFQVVNGGQTTASLYHTARKYPDADLTKVFVQMKLTVIKDEAKKNEEVPNIARFANSQNKVSELDLSSNNPFFIQIETLSRKKYVINPENRNLSTLWYFERVKGQYKEALNNRSKSQQNKFKQQNPTNQKFVKSDIAKYINLWELEPHTVSQGSQKNFISFTKKIQDKVKREILPGENYYKKLIGLAKLFREVDKLFGRKNSNPIGDTSVKSYSVSYTLSLLFKITENKLDLWKIYEEQKVDEKLLTDIKTLMREVYYFLTESSDSLTSEYAKRKTTWDKLQEKNLIIQIHPSLLISDIVLGKRELDEKIQDNQIEDDIIQKDKIFSLGLKFWDGLKIMAKDNVLFKNVELELWTIVSKLQRSKNLTKRDISIGLNALKIISENKISREEILNGSSLSQDNVFSPKQIFDRMQLLKKDDWNRIISLAEQTKAATYPEISNLKVLRTSFEKKMRTIKPISLQKGHTLLLKLSKKFKVKY